MKSIDVKEQRMIDFLLENAGTSIRYRVKRDILKDISPDEEQNYQEQILQEPIIRFICHSQQKNGWIGLGFHGSSKNAGQFDNQEVATKYLGEKGLQGTDVLNKAMDAYEHIPLTDLCYQTNGKYYSEFEYAAYGHNLIRCACIARAGYANIFPITLQIDLSLASFDRVNQVDSIFDISRPCKNYRLFYQNEKWPCKYHFEILAFTDGWKSEENQKRVASAFVKLMRNDRTKIMETPVACWVGHAVGPLWYLNEGYAIARDDGAHHCVNMEVLEWMTRCGLYPYIPALQDEVAYIISSIDENGIFTGDFDEDTFKSWGPYSGLKLESDWKSRKRKQCDVTFRALQILKNSIW